MVHQEDFGPDFHWGVSTAAYQTEGAWDLHNKGKSIWDVFAQTKGKIKNGHTGNVASDFYTLYETDIQILAGLGIPNFRFSISWSRIFPMGTGLVNHHGISFYNRVIDCCLKNGVTPWITLYHWDLPYELEKKGGWTNRDILGWFENYVAICVLQFGDRVKNWIILNEPMVFTGTGHFLGMHAPGRKGMENFLPAAHHAALCQAGGARVVRSLLSDAYVGTTFSCSLVEPARNRESDFRTVKRVDALLNRVFIEPLAGLGYPFKDLPLLKGIEKYMREGDEQKLEAKLDFIGIQNYTREIVTYSPFTPWLKARIISAEKRKVPSTIMNWEIFPEALYKMLMKFSKYNNFKDVLVTENGAAFPDKVIDNRINDTERIRFLNDNLQQLHRAKQEGVNVCGYFVWTLTDNFEWAEGFTPRFGLVYVDFETQQRIIKDSGYWYGSFINHTK